MPSDGTFGSIHHIPDLLSGSKVMGLPSIAYFPYIDVDPSLLRGTLVYFEQVHLFHPSFFLLSGPDKSIKKRQWVHAHCPIELPIDDKASTRLMREYELFVRQHQDSGYLDYIKHGGLSGLTELPGYALIREIKTYGHKKDPKVEERERVRGQILLALAQRWDRQRREIQEGLEELRGLQRALHQSLGTEPLEEPLPPEAMDLPGPEKDTFMIPQRLAAWSELYNASPLAGVLCPLTDNLYAWREAVGGGDDEDEGENGLQFELPRFFPTCLEEVESARAALAGLMSWRVLCEKVDALVKASQRALTSDKAMEEWEINSRALSSYFNENVLGEAMERLLDLGIGAQQGWARWTLKGRPSRDLGMVLFWGE